MSTLITGIAELTTHDPDGPDGLGSGDGPFALVTDGGRVAWTGRAADAPAADERVDVEGRAVLPGWVDSHTHLVFAGDRGAEFAARMAGEPYAASGIRTTVEATRAASDDALEAGLRRHVDEAARQGTTCLETKTGYGLTVADEARAARLAAAVVDEVTFLGAHVVPAGAEPGAYLDQVCGPMLDAVAAHVGWIDVFCEHGAFDEESSARVLRAGAAAGLGLRVHGNQLGTGPGVRLAVAHGAASVDHCTHLSGDDVDALAGSDTVATLLPACDLSTRQPPAPARRLADAGATIALASNANPGSSWTTSMPLCVALAVLQGGLSVAEAVRAATLGGARALRRTDVGTLAVGARADVQVLDAPSVAHLAYRPGVPLTWAV
ncbi:imidazolonepropionase, partial [Pseudonocardia sp. KRD291]|uniref:imidazolonepropionase n=1 Tax=Pseudonocardia sp. KRD291 TaxID=2792007 RepID=UPI001C4A0C38